MKQRLILPILFLITLLVPAYSQEQSSTFLTVSGVVVDGREKLAYVSVGIKGSTMATITNEDGWFSLKIPKTEKDITLVISHVGYHATELTRAAADAHDMKISLTPYHKTLEGARIIGEDAEHILFTALQKIRQNYPMSPVMQRGFYRETVQKGKKYTSVSEAVVDMFKYAYNRDTDMDRVRVLKGRKLMSQKSADTLGVKLLGGPNLTLALDVVKNHDDLFYNLDLPKYSYSMEESTVIEERPVYVIKMTPKRKEDRYPLYNARVFIDKEKLAIMRVEYSVDMEDTNLVTASILRRKPSGIHFEPLGVDFIASYRMLGDVTVMQYVRSSIKFKCDWRKRLFRSSFAVVSEVVATDIATENIDPIIYKEAFKERDSFSDRVNDFADPHFWGDYNILEPSESLEHAVERLRRRVR